jgi:hypothetical protein
MKLLRIISEIKQVVKINLTKGDDLGKYILDIEEEIYNVLYNKDWRTNIEAYSVLCDRHDSDKWNNLIYYLKSKNIPFTLGTLHSRGDKNTKTLKIPSINVNVVKR